MTGPVDASFALHQNDDVDARLEAHHHTIGMASYQAAPGDHTHDGINSLPVASVPTGSILPFAGDDTQVPSGFLACNGAAVSTTTYADLYKLIGTKYNAAGGGTPGAGLFRTPNLTGRFPVKYDGTNFNIGDTGGVSSISLAHTHSTPNHTHTLSALGRAMITMVAGTPSLIMRRTASNNWTPTLSSVPPSTASYSTQQNTGAELDGGTDSGGSGITSSAGSGSVSTLPPYLTINYIIKT